MWKKRPGSGFLQKRDHSNECLYCLKSKNGNGDLLNLFSTKGLLCSECATQLKHLNTTIQVEEMECYVLYEYNTFFSKLLLQYKELNDEALYPVFLENYKNFFEKNYEDFCVVPVPSSPSKIEKRGFDAVLKMFSIINLEQKSVFYKKETKDQKNSNLKERREVFKYIHLKNDANIQKMKILLVDDVITSGSSLLACYRILKEQECQIKVISLSYCSDNGT